MLQAPSHNYSIDNLKRAAFVDELNNHLKVLREQDMINDNQKIVLQYLEERVKEIDKKYN
jgi:hypothetical protein